MKNIVSFSIFVFLLMSLASPVSTHAEPGSSASGIYRFVLEDDFTKSVEFTASLDERGTTTGQMTFRDEAGVVEEEEGSGGGHEDQPTEFYMTANLDSLTIEHNRAVMGGTVTASSNERYIGRWVQLVVEDNGDGSERPDQLTWCFCKPEEGGWVPADAEVPGDQGAFSTWWATDAELRDDVGVHSTNIIPGNKTSCKVYPLSVYPFADIRGEGQIQVQP